MTRMLYSAEKMILYKVGILWVVLYDIRGGLGWGVRAGGQQGHYLGAMAAINSRTSSAVVAQLVQ